MPFDNTAYRDTIARKTAGFTLTLGVFDNNAQDKRREIQLPVVWEAEARLQQKDGDPAPMRLTDCIDKGEISNSSDTLWIVDVKQNWVGEDQGERKALYAMNQIVAARHSDHVCDTMILGLKKDKCLEHLGKNKPGTTHPFVCQTDEERPEGLPEGAYPFEGLMILGPTGKEVKGYNDAKLD
ncbi:hypothetical protein FFLO_05170 [Filobasidium floriforme]|uniref:Uncharacterized protein n=1 Tax=Filobasidium floriforme TaxID=5210 RepID=A0A8K0JHG7_9TREE|nr:hypothetical protein FFLO_05170 [Filobasidium floriforme]